MNLIRYTVIILFMLTIAHTILYYYNLDIFQYMFKSDSKKNNNNNNNNKINLEENIKELQHSLQELDTLT